MTLIKVIVGSTRPGRFGTQPANWVMELAKQYPKATFELVDLAELNLPVYDEPIPPTASNGNYVNDHTKQWSKLIDEADGYVIVTGEYNHGIPGALKNAIDYLATEWYYKPVAFVSYGAKAGGVRAVEQLREVFGQLRAYDMHDEVSIKNYWTQQDQDGVFKTTDEQNEDAMRLLQNIIFWSDKMTPARKALQ